MIVILLCYFYISGFGTTYQSSGRYTMRLRYITQPIPDRRYLTSKYVILQIFFTNYVLLAGTRLTLKTGVKTLNQISFLPLSLRVKIIITYIIRVFDTTGESNFWALKFFFLANFLFFHVDLKAIKANDPVKNVSVLYLLRFLRNVVLKLMPWCQ